MKNERSVLSLQQLEYARSLFRDPVLFARYVLCVELWEREVEILLAAEKIVGRR